MKILELFSGTGSFSKVAKARGHEVFTVDIEKRFNPNICEDILELEASEILEKFGRPDVIWASPPCTVFSIAAVYRYWKEGKPSNEKTLKGIEIVKKTLKLINELKPKYFFIENPRGMLRKQSFMFSLPIRNTVTYCSYGFNYQKATDIWNNLPAWIPKMPCKANAPCHERAQRSSSGGVQGVKSRKGMHDDSRYTMKRDAETRAIIPPALCIEILDALEGKNSIKQEILCLN